MTPLALYVHIPFCSSKCHYCAFSVVTQQEQQAAYIEELLRELAQRLPERPVDTIYIGGGTPSLLERSLMEQLLAALPRVPEITVECNPEQVTEEYITFLKAHGVTRISLGIQSLEDRVLQTMNRQHTSAEAIHAMTVLQNSGLSWNADLIIGLPEVTHAAFLADLKTILSYDPPHVSCYFLAIEPGTVLSRNYQPSDDDAELYLTVCDILAKAKFEHTEISNWAKSGHTCKHNLHYWHAEEYLGIGLSASSYLQGTVQTSTRNLQVYLQGIWLSEEPLLLSHQDKLALLLTSSSRLAEGIPWHTIESCSTPAEIAHIRKASRHLASFLEDSPTHMRLKESSFPLHEAILRALLP